MTSPITEADEKQELVQYNSQTSGEIDPMYEYYQVQNWKVCFPEKKETEKKSSVWYICDEETRQVHRIIVEKSFMETFGIFLDGNLLAIIDIQWASGKCIIRKYLKDSPYNVECTGDTFGLAQIRFTLSGRQYELIRNSNREDIYLPTFYRSVRLLVDGLEMSSSGWVRGTPQFTKKQMMGRTLGLLGVSYVVGILCVYFPLLLMPVVLWFSYVISRDIRHRRNPKPHHLTLPKRELIESISVIGADEKKENDTSRSIQEPPTYAYEKEIRDEEKNGANGKEENGKQQMQEAPIL